MSPNCPPGRSEPSLGPAWSGPGGASPLLHIYKSVVFIAQRCGVTRPAEWAKGAAVTAGPWGQRSSPAADLLGDCGGGPAPGGRRPSLRPSRLGSVTCRGSCKEARIPVRPPAHASALECAGVLVALCVFREL